MTARESRRAKDTKLLSGLLSAALVVSLVPTSALAESIEELPAEPAPVVAEADAGEGIEVSPEGAADEAARAEEPPADGAAIEAVAQDAPVVAQDTAGAAEAKADEKLAGEAVAAEAKADEKKADEKKADEAKEGTVYYIKRGWDGSKVTESQEPCNEAKPLPKDGKLTGGWYVLDADAAYKDRMEVTGDTQLILGDGHTLKANKGIYVAQGATLTIYSEPGESGKLVADADTGAGIGAYSGHKGGDVVIHSGTVEAHGADHCAGIGSNDGDEQEVGSCTIYGGTVTATGGKGGAGIGGGQASEGGHVTIYGGEVTGEGGHYGAGIGGGNGKDDPVRGAHAGTIEIFGGKVTGKGGDDGAGIGGGEGGNAGSITINGGEVTGIATNNAAGIGCGEAESTGNGGTVTINGGEVEGQGGNDGAGIGGGNHGVCEVVVTGGDVTGRGKEDGAGVGSGEDADDDGMAVTISGGEVVGYGDKQGAGIGGGNNTDGGKITITGTGWATAHPGKEGAGIGGGENGDGGTITISDNGTAFCIDANRGAAIGGGNDAGAGGKITISGGNVTAKSEYGAGIGGGRGKPDSGIQCQNHHDSGSGGDITISGGIIKADSEQGFGIGAGAACNGVNYKYRIGSTGHVIIDDGHIEAHGSYAGIGGDNGTIDIKGGEVHASGVWHEQYNWGEKDYDWVCDGSGLCIMGPKGTINISGGKVEAKAEGGTWSAICSPTINITGGGVGAQGQHRAINGRTLTISGRDTSVNAGVMGGDFSNIRDVCIAGGDSESSDVDDDMSVVVADGARLTAWHTTACSDNAKVLNIKSLKVYDGARCKAGDDVVVDNREDALRDTGARTVDIAPCEHKNVRYEESEHGHICHCNECRATFEEERHSFGVDFACTKCGRKAEVGDVTATFDPGDGRGCYKIVVVPGNTVEPPKDLKMEKPGQAFKGWFIVDENGNTTGETFDFSKPLREDVTLRAVWAPTAPTCKKTEILESGGIGVVYKMELPGHEARCWGGSYMEFKVGGKNAKTIRVPYEESTYMGGDCRSFVCPVSATQLADHISATFHYGDTSVSVEAPDGLDNVIALSNCYWSYNETYNRALQDYGHYMQASAAKEYGWKLGEGGDRELIEAKTAFDKTTVAETKKSVADIAPIDAHKCDTVTAATAKLGIGSETSLQILFKTSADIKELIIDGGTVDPSVAQKTDEGWLVVIDGIRAKQLADPHEVRLTTTGEGDTTAVVSGISPISYARNVLNDKRYANDTDTQYAMAALCRYWQAVK